MYRPRQGDVIWIDFDPALGIEIKKRRPALVISSDYYHGKTKMAIIVPITSKYRAWPSRHELQGYPVFGQVNSNQIFFLI